MQAREFMERVRQAEEELKLIAERRRHYMEMATSTTSRLTPVVVKTGPSSKVENAVVGMTDLLTRLDVREAEYTAIVQQAEQLIERIEHPRTAQPRHITVEGRLLEGETVRQLG